MRDGHELNPLQLRIEEAARLLAIDPDAVRADIEAGLPTNIDGSLNLIIYAAWLNVQIRGAADAT